MSKVDEQDLIYCLRISLLDTDVWREVLVPSSFTAAKLHGVIQIAMGWEDSHLHELRRAECIVEETLPLSALFSRVGSKLSYLYDMGDSWEHDIALVRKLAATEEGQVPRCTDGALACPPEDCGGVGSYHELLDLRAKKAHDEDDLELLEWLGDWVPDRFDQAAVNRALAKKFKASVKKKTVDGSPFTPTQGQYLAFIFWSTRVNRQPPAQSDIQAFFGVTPPSVNTMLGTLERLGLLERPRGQARSLRVLVDEEKLPRLEEPNSPMIPVGRGWTR